MTNQNIKDREIIHSRLLNAPTELVFKGTIQSDLLICLLNDLGCLVEVLREEPSVSQTFSVANYSN